MQDDTQNGQNQNNDQYAQQNNFTDNPQSPVGQQVNVPAGQNNLQPSQPYQPPQPLPVDQPQYQQPQTMGPQQYGPPMDQSAPHPASSNSGTYVLQWLTYAFWGWTVLAMSFLVTAIVYNFISGEDNSGFATFGVASTLILLPISIICDRLYVKHEPVKKVGPTSIIMVIHAVIFALFGIGALISAVVSAGFFFTSSSDGTASKVGLISSLIIAVFYGLVFVRTMFASKIPLFRRFFPIGMALVVGLIAVMGIFGPVAQERRTRTDRLIRDNLSNVEREVGLYADKNKKLPENLPSLDLTGDPKKLIDQNLIKYTPNSKSAKIEPQGINSIAGAASTGNSTEYYYTMCVTYTADSSKNYYGGYSPSSGDDYSDFGSYYDYKKGEKCYKLKHASYDQ